ncbi:MAG TPA: hypothetical protein VHV83_07000 [Armatimonadota bacterium]|nr:hypothetical protein [Armatimonadota bacterium]
MPKLGSYLKLIQYAPMIIGAVKQLRTSPTSEVNEEIAQTKQTLDDIKKNLLSRIEDLENENARLKTRIREVESSVTITRVLVLTSGGAAIVALVLALIAIIR